MVAGGLESNFGEAESVPGAEGLSRLRIRFLPEVIVDPAYSSRESVLRIISIDFVSTSRRCAPIL